MFPHFPVSFGICWLPCIHVMYVLHVWHPMLYGINAHPVRYPSVVLVGSLEKEITAPASTEWFGVHWHLTSVCMIHTTVPRESHGAHKAWGCNMVFCFNPNLIVQCFFVVSVNYWIHECRRETTLLKINVFPIKSCRNNAGCWNL